MRTSVVTGAVNAIVALSATFVLRTPRPNVVRTASAVVIALLAALFVRGEAFATD